MSRSYRKNPVVKDRYGSKALKFYKRLSNKKVRHSSGIHNHCSYKKVFDSWEIHDYKSRVSKNDYIKQFIEEQSCHKLYRYFIDVRGCHSVDDVLTQYKIDYLIK